MVSSSSLLLTQIMHPSGFNDVRLAATDVLKWLMSSSEYSYPDSDENYTKAFKAVAVSLAYPLVRFFQRSLKDIQFHTM